MEIAVEGFDAVDNANIQDIKAVMAAQAREGDAASALAYSHLLSNETARQQLLVSAAATEIEMDKSSLAPAPSSWTESVREGGRPAAAELMSVAA